MGTYYEKDFRAEEKGLKRAAVSADARHIVKHLWILAVCVPAVLAVVAALLVSAR